MEYFYKVLFVLLPCYYSNGEKIQSKDVAHAAFTTPYDEVKLQTQPLKVSTERMLWPSNVSLIVIQW